MKNAKGLVVAVLASLALVAAAFAWPSTSHATPNPPAITEQTPATPQTVSGKIASVAKDSFTLTIAGQSSSGHQLLPQEAKTMTFQVDKNTTIDGKLKVNANADVTYRDDSGKLVAISVHVAS